MVWFLLFTLTSFVPCEAVAWPTVVAQDDEAEQKKQLDAHPAVKAFRAFSKNVKESDIAAASKQMTDGAADEFAAKSIIQGGAYLTPEFAARNPDRKEVIEALSGIYANYELDELVSGLSKMPKMRFTVHEYAKKNSTTRNFKKAKAIHDQVLAVLDKNKKRWQIVSEVRAARKNDPRERFLMHEGEPEEIVVDKEYAYLKVRPGLENSVNDAFSKVFVPRVVVRMRKVDDSWLFDGGDSRRSKDAIRESPLYQMNRGR